jgi:hypothetical protein
VTERRARGQVAPADVPAPPVVEFNLHVTATYRPSSSNRPLTLEKVIRAAIKEFTQYVVYFDGATYKYQAELLEEPQAETPTDDKTALRALEPDEVAANTVDDTDDETGQRGDS